MLTIKAFEKGISESRFIALWLSVGQGASQSRRLNAPNRAYARRHTQEVPPPPVSWPDSRGHYDVGEGLGLNG